MFSILLEAVAVQGASGIPRLCPPCHEEPDFSYFGLFMSVLKSLVTVISIVFPLYKTFKAWESDRIRVCRTMLAYWSAMCLLNCMKDVTDEIVGQWLNKTLHHILVAAIKLAPMILGPDRIYDLTARPFFEKNEEKLDNVIKTANAEVHKAMDAAAPVIHQVQEAAAPVIHQVQEQMDHMKDSVTPVLEQLSTQIDNMKETMSDTVHTLGESLGMSKEPNHEDELAKEKERAQKEMRAYDADVAMKVDRELNPTSEDVIDFKPTEDGGLKRRKPVSAAVAEPVNQAVIDEAARKQVLVEKIVWGRGLMAKNEEFQRQQQSGVATGAADEVATATAVSSTPAPTVVSAETTSATTNTAGAITTIPLTNRQQSTSHIPPTIPPRPTTMPTTSATTTNTQTTTTPITTPLTNNNSIAPIVSSSTTNTIAAIPASTVSGNSPDKRVTTTNITTINNHDNSSLNAPNTYNVHADPTTPTAVVHWSSDIDSPPALTTSTSAAADVSNPPLSSPMFTEKNSFIHTGSRTATVHLDDIPIVETAEAIPVSHFSVKKA